MTLIRSREVWETHMDPHPDQLLRDRAGGPIPDDVETMARDVMWYAYALGDDRPAVPGVYGEQAGFAAPDAPEEVAPRLPVTEPGAPATPLPLGTVELLERMPYPCGRAPEAGTSAEALGHALVTAFGPHRREPENPINDHRGYASVRSKFPVHAFVADRERRQVLDVHRNALVDLAGANPPQDPSADGCEILLIGRYTRLPASYRWFRGALVHLEMGIALRSLCLALELFGLSGRLRLPNSGQGRLREFGLRPAWEWTLPLTVELAERPAPVQTTGRGADTVPDPVLADVLAMNRAQTFTEAPATLGPAAPSQDDVTAAAERSWAELLWSRTSGRMPRGLYGMNGRRRVLPAAVLQDAVRWLGVPPPGDVLRGVSNAIRTTVVIQGIEGHRDGVYEVADGHTVLKAADTTAAARLEEVYGYTLAPGNGCDVRHASMIWFLTVDPRVVVDRYGPGGWTTIQYVCGWAAHGLTLAAAGSGLYARPVRAFYEAAARRVLGLGSEEMVVLAVIGGTPGYRGLMLDLRS
ncbi:hypothetical protein ThrDRAFT_03731 [Frankia casuarinae]|uniref:Nitroreductase domain-containing protein n=2 Tax=Frankiaceae TaxID=74712 RepID=Q2J595_FRACC|nr:hypothetical protein Francci3_4199 [Frankia casuarinae]EYT90626.1 hypothetical protein ThrDRAFT_03731 [Frankia casuarinae]